MEYYFQDQLRWTFGFDNPNKAAALIASLLPLAWLLANALSQFKRPALNWIGMLAGVAILCAGWWLLFKTYSRGGIVAAVVAFAYIGFCKRESMWKLRLWILACVVVIATLFLSTHAAERSVGWIVNHEGSVENRFTLWKGGLEMLATNPQGVGSGNSGLFYMQWYQPLEMTARYRTMVNSYLTFAVERGLWIFAASCFLAFGIWNAASRTHHAGFMQDVVTTLKASVLAFAVAGLFSTTMEEAKLWIWPALCMAGLAALVLVEMRKISWGGVIKQSAVICIVLCGTIYASGLALQRNEPLKIHLDNKQNGTVTIEPAQKSSRSATTVRVLVDEEVMGQDYGKLLRRLATGSGLRVVTSESPDASLPQETLLVSGQCVGRLQNLKNQNLVFLAPARISGDDAANLLRSATTVKLLLPGFDEDGRAAFWYDAAKDAKPPASIKTVSLDGVGTEVEWAWEAVVQQFKR